MTPKNDESVDFGEILLFQMTIELENEKQCVAVKNSVLQCIAVCCTSVLQRIAVASLSSFSIVIFSIELENDDREATAIRCNTLMQHTAIHCNTLFFIFQRASLSIEKLL